MRIVLFPLCVVIILVNHGESPACSGGGGGGTASSGGTSAASVGFTPSLTTTAALASPVALPAAAQQLAYQQYLRAQAAQLQLAQQQLMQDREALRAERAEQQAVARAELMEQIRQRNVARRQVFRALLIAKREARERRLESPTSWTPMLASNP